MNSLIKVEMTSHLPILEEMTTSTHLFRRRWSLIYYLRKDGHLSSLSTFLGKDSHLDRIATYPSTLEQCIYLSTYLSI